MRRWMWIAALGAALIAAPVWAQRRGGMASAGVWRGGFAARGPAIGYRGSAFRGFHGGVGFANTFHRPFGFRNQFFRHRFFAYPWSYGYGAGYYAYPYYYDPFFDYGLTSSSYPDYTASYAGQINQMQEAEIQHEEMQRLEVDRLEDEVDRLREEREARPTAPQPAPAQSQPVPQTPTLLVFRDQHTQEVQNYAIVGKTLWVLTDQRARKVSLDALDVPATVKANDDRGVDFRVPE